MVFLVTLARGLALFTAVFGVVVGIIRIANQLEDAEVSWLEDDRFEKDDNYFSWCDRGFSFVPSIFIPLWTPLFFSLWALSQHIASLRYGDVNKTMLSSMVFHIIFGLFGLMGYAGNVGIMASAFAYLTAFVCLVGAICSSGASPNHDLKAPLIG
jgi:hypothetical protein